MRQKIMFLFLLLVVQAFACPPAGSLENSERANTVETDDALMEHIDFGNSYIRGQTIQSGAVAEQIHAIQFGATDQCHYPIATNLEIPDMTLPVVVIAALERALPGHFY